MILSQVLHSKFSPDGEGTSTPSLQKGQWSPGLDVGNSACWSIEGKLAHSGPAGNRRLQESATKAGFVLVDGMPRN